MADNTATAGEISHGRIVAEVEAATARHIEVGSWERFKAYAESIGAGPASASFYDGVPVSEAGDLSPDQVRVLHRTAPFEAAQAREWITRYRLPE